MMNNDFLLFKDWFLDEFKKWESKQPKKRSSVSAFARWLSQNSLDKNIKQQIADSWINGVVPKDELYILVLAEKLGNEVYEVLGIDPINPLRIYVLRNWDNAPEKTQLELAKIISKHTAEPLPNVHPTKSK